jgi:hypothetical protein
MKVIRQNHDRIDYKGALSPGRPERQPKRVDIIDEGCRLTVRQR